MNNNLKKDHRELSILVSRYGLSFLFKDKNPSQSKFFEYLFEQTNPFEIENKLKKIFQERPVLTRQFKNIRIIHHNNLNTLVPIELFNEKNPEEYLKFNIKLLEFDRAHFDTIDSLEIANVYIPFANINNLFLDYYDEIDFFHSATIFIEKIDKTRSQKEVLSLYDVYLNVFHRDFQMLIYKNEDLIFFNSFEFSTNDDFLYFFFFVLETLKIPENKAEFHIAGVDKNFVVMKDLKDFVENWNFLSAENPGKLNNYIP